MRGYREGQRVGNYRLVKLLGRKDVTEVYIGEHPRQQKQIALKLMYGQRDQDETRQFLIQASTLLDLHHPHIVPVLDFGIEGDCSFLVMDYIPHGSLRERHAKGEHIPLQTVLAYVKQIASALQYVHQHNLVHRDVKPRNLLLGDHDQVMLSDFGIAIVSHSLASIHPDLSDFEGTVPYAAPEQLQGQPRRSSDQYALGVVVYEWLCGDWPFSGTFDEITLQHLLTLPPSFQARGIDLPIEIEQVVMRALAKDPAERFATVEQFAQALEEAMGRQSERPISKQFRSPFPFHPQ